ncbi:MAG: hypothetical protein JNL08_18505 [Planctomycetes bacterium]|nr:hypothetical protein [Planctomycetota bacterium]
MQLADVLPWAWGATAALAAWRTRGAGGRSWWWPCAGALLLLSLYALGWNKPIYLAGKNALIWLGVYEARLWFKVAIGLVVFPLLLWAARQAFVWSRRLSALQRAALAVMAVNVFYITVRTLSVDGWMPLCIGVEPGKSLLGAALALGALLCTALARPRPAPEEHGLDRR